jgi:hypothetical protein
MGDPGYSIYEGQIFINFDKSGNNFKFEKPTDTSDIIIIHSKKIDVNYLITKIC